MLITKDGERAIRGDKVYEVGVDLVYGEYAPTLTRLTGQERDDPNSDYRYYMSYRKCLEKCDELNKKDEMNDFEELMNSPMYNKNQDNESK